MLDIEALKFDENGLIPAVVVDAYSKKVLTYFPETAMQVKNGEYTGSPIRLKTYNVNKTDAYEHFGFNGKKPVLLVTGGSLGAQKINATLREALDSLLPIYDIIHICGKGNIDENINKKGYFQTEFIVDMSKPFAICSVCVTRAGSNTLFELLSLNIPSVLIPLPKGVSRGDQVENATYFQKLGLVNVLNQESLTKESLALAINSTYQGRNAIYKNMQTHPVKDSSRQISKIIADYKR